MCCPVNFSTECTEFSRLRKMESATLRTVPRREKNKSLETGMPRHCASGTAPGHFFPSQEVIQKIHALNLLLEICTPVHIQGKRYVLMSEDFRKRLYIKLRYLDCSNCECMPDLMKLHFLQSVPFQKTGEKLAISTRLCRLCFASQEVVVRVIRVELLDNVHQKRRNRNRPCRSFRFGRSDVKI